MNKKQTVKTSKFLSYVLRHRPDEIGITLDENGWVDLEQLIDAANAKGHQITREQIARAVEQNDKKRFSISDDGRRIRARQGHSIAVDLGLEPTTPPAVLYHGTAQRNLGGIRLRGLIKARRQYVHLSPDPQTATRVGARHGQPVVLTIKAAAMHESGIKFFLSENGVWLVESAPPQFIEFPPDN